MAKNAVTDWSSTASSNTDVGGVNIDEFCPSAGINNAIREIMAQIATWITGVLLKTGGAMTGAITGMSTTSTVKDGAGTERYVGYRSVPYRAASSQQTLALTDVGAGIAITTGGIIIPANATVAFPALDTSIVIYNHSGSSQTIAPAATVTLRLAGSASTGSRTLAQRGKCLLEKVDTNEWVASGQGLT
jgi:hypothetical protein